jgi:hypothetical protein
MGRFLSNRQSMRCDNTLAVCVCIITEFVKKPSILRVMSTFDNYIDHYICKPVQQLITTCCLLLFYTNVCVYLSGPVYCSCCCFHPCLTLLPYFFAHLGSAVCTPVLFVYIYICMHVCSYWHHNAVCMHVSTYVCMTSIHICMLLVRLLTTVTQWILSIQRVDVKYLIE